LEAVLPVPLLQSKASEGILLNARCCDSRWAMACIHAVMRDVVLVEGHATMKQGS
jgi:hypothetical protein